MLSVIMPYWNRQELLNRSLNRFDELYADLGMEVIIASDGCSVELDPHEFPVKVVNLPTKSEPKNPCVPLNLAAESAAGNILVITNPEIYHIQPVFESMAEDLLNRGPKGYVIASCWGVEEDRWYCFPDFIGPGVGKMPPNSGLHFCSIMYKPFFDEIGGFDEIFRDGAGYEDNDFAWSVHKGGGNVVVRPDLVVHHRKTNIKWGSDKFSINKHLFENKWKNYWDKL